MRVSDINVGTRFVSVAGEYRVTSVIHAQGHAAVELQPISGGTSVNTIVVSTTHYGRWIA